MFIHPEETLEAITARVNAVRERFSRRLEEYSPEYEALPSLKTQMDDIEQSRKALETILREVKYDQTHGLASYENYKYRVL